jgi:hypothetical protein
MVWTIDGQALALESIPALSRRFFGQLVKVSRGEANNTETFVFNPHDLSAIQPEVVVERSYEPDDQAIFFSEKPRPSEMARQAVIDRPGHTLAQLANVGQSQGIMPLSGPNASIHAARSAGADLLGQPQPEPSQSPGHASFPLGASSNNSANQFANPAAAPRQLSIAPPTPEPEPQPAVISEPAAAAPREELSFFSKTVQEPKEETIKPAAPEVIAVLPEQKPAEQKVEATKAPEVIAAQEVIAAPSPVAQPEEKPEVKAEAKTEARIEVKAAPEVAPEPKAADRATATAAAIASQATTQTLSNAGVNGEKSTYHFMAKPEEEAQKVDVNADKDIAENNRKVAHAIKNLFDSVDSSITALTAVGVDAMKADDIAAVGSIMRQTKTLKVLRDGIVQLSKDWQKSLEN